MKITTLDEALERIKELEHDEAWMAAYNDFMLKYESGMTLMEIVAEGDVSRRTAYRYLAYYRELQKLTENSKSVQK